MRRFTDWKLKTQLIATTWLIVFVLSGTLTVYNVVATIRANRQDIADYRFQTLKDRKENLWNYMDIAFETIRSRYQNTGDEAWIESQYGKRLESVIDLAESDIRLLVQEAESGRISLVEARQRAAESLRNMRYDSGQGYLWITDIGEPIPRMLMHPLSPELEGRILDDPAYNTVGDNRENLFSAMVRTAAKNSNGFVRYDWPKPGSEDISRGAPKLSAVRLIPEWGWVIGTGAYIDDAMDRAKESARESIREMRYDNGTGYFWINNATLPFPTMIMHPTAPNLEGKVLDNPAYNSVGENKENLFVKSVEVTTVSESGYIDYLWPKPTQNGLSEEMPKISFVRLFEPWNWIVGTGLYTDDIDEIVAEREAAMKAKVVRIILVFVAITLLVAFVAMSIFVVLLRFISRPINDVVKWSHGLAAGD